MIESPDDLLTSREAAEALGIHPRSIPGLCRTTKLECVQKAGRYYPIRHSVESFYARLVERVRRAS